MFKIAAGILVFVAALSAQADDGDFTEIEIKTDFDALVPKDRERECAAVR